MAKHHPGGAAARQTLELLQESLRRGSERSLKFYLDNVVIDCVPHPRRFGDVVEPWQRVRDDTLTPAVEFIAGLRPEYGGPRNFWFGFSKGSDKSSSLARYLNWTLAFAPRRSLRCYCGAKDAVQAGVILDCMRKEAELNPWMQSRLEFKRNKVDGVANGAQLHVLTSDAEGVHGINPDLIVADELSHWASDALFDALFSGSGKRSGHCVFVVLTNAGYRDTWQWRLRRDAEAENGRGWFFYEQPQGKTLASWMSQSVIQQMSRLMTPTEFRRLYCNEWLDLTQDRGFLVAEDVDRCVGKPQPPPPGATVFLGVDYGGVKDRTALALLWFDGEVVHVCELECWQGGNSCEVPVAEVENWVDRKLKQYPNAVAVFDTHQMLQLIQKVEARGVRVKRFDYKGGRSNYAMAESMRSLVTNTRIRFAADAGAHPDGTTLADELKRLIVKPVNSWYRFDHASGEHDDRTVAVGMAAMEAVLTSPPPPAKNRPDRSPLRLPPLRPGGGFAPGGDNLSRRRLYGLR